MGAAHAGLRVAVAGGAGWLLFHADLAVEVIRSIWTWAARTLRQEWRFPDRALVWWVRVWCIVTAVLSVARIWWTPAGL